MISQEVALRLLARRKVFLFPAIRNEFGNFHPHLRPVRKALRPVDGLYEAVFQISRLQLFEMIGELFANTVVICHHEKLFKRSRGFIYVGDQMMSSNLKISLM